MHYVLIYPGFGVLGGIETLIARMSRWLVKNGHEVTVLTESLRNWGDLLPSQAQSIALGDRFRELYYYFHAGKLRKEFGIRPPDVIKGFDLQSSWVACQLAALSGKQCKVIAGNYNPNVFKQQYAGEARAFWRVERLHLKNYLENIPSSARIFCWSEDMQELEDAHGQRGVVWPLPIDTKLFHAASRRPQWGKIVSVGRLSIMKEYNFYMIDVVRQLLDKGHNISWTVYGEGKYESQMRDCIRKQGLETVITLKGSTPYERLWQAIEDAYVFVGMGTAVLEASLFGVPAVVAQAYDREGLTHGPVYRVAPGSVHPPPGQPTLKVVDELERILKLSPAEYAIEEEAVRSHVQEHEMESAMKNFLGLVDAAEPFSIQRSLYFLNYPLHFVRRLKGYPPAQPTTPVALGKGAVCS